MKNSLAETTKRRLPDDDEGTSKVDKRVNQDYKRSRDLNCVIVRNLPKSSNQHKIRKLFQDCGEIKHIDVCESEDKTTRISKIEFCNYDETLSALTKTLKQVGAKRIEVSIYKDSTLWITNFPPGYTAVDIKLLFSELNKSVLSVRLPSLRFNANRRFAYVDLLCPEDAQYCISALNGKDIDGYSLVIKVSNPLERTKRTDAAVVERREIFVRNLDAQTITEEQLRLAFAGFGSIEGIRIPKGPDHETSGDLKNACAFITYKIHEEALAAVSLNNTDLNGRTITVALADRKSYLERQEIKHILNNSNSGRSLNIFSLYPLSDRVSKEQIRILLKDSCSVETESIKDIFLVTDLKGALVDCNDDKVAAKCIMKLDNTTFQNKTINCGSVNDLKNSGRGKPTRHQRPALLEVRPQTVTETKNEEPVSKPQMSNDDFRKMFLGK
ncbi:U6 snRNP complex subunit PRP24 KNAG_0J00360 [Huiozyma naganishii CBS 8797]|uniref:RRM domain-containing protein n=1 Tax=Huiozyma naganishii (strain ATCC MYA-139 / BCRC 22969 / CBS 8797 / KCTC 17520 / NBRC 10181 / NCYC 3082 / Yp74L-3) TaxID=1071383 RepID=J7S9H8_HUIN7|nr:hypothetical protein KNAG_0J00360 [Kazachstania naganishii CBS 8797]CCK72119.1 hypothetical protein KNAG_0J00360 [Kazachstania naganishii CBS 8797]